MNARELHDFIVAFGPIPTQSISAPLTKEAWETILSALSILAAAQANDGKTPETDAESCWPASNDSPDKFCIDGGYVSSDFARSLELRCRSLAAEVVRLKEDEKRIDWMIEHGTDEGGGRGFEFRVFIPCDSEDLRTAIDSARAGK